MHTQLFQAALAAMAVLLLPVRSEAQSVTTASPARVESARVAVGTLLSHREGLSLTRGQVDSLSALATRICEDRGRIQIAGLDRVPGKSVPRVARVFRVRREAKGLALRLLTPDQRMEAEKLLDGPSQPSAAY